MSQKVRIVGEEGVVELEFMNLEELEDANNKQAATADESEEATWREWVRWLYGIES